MGLESGQYISDLVVTNPPTTDSKQQGDDHIRLIKTVLRNTFPNVTKPIYQPDAAPKAASFSIVAADMNKTFVVDTTAGQVTVTLPTLVAGDAGWQCFVMKLGLSNNPILITPPSGNILSGHLSLASTRRCIPHIPCRVSWTGSNWVAERAIGVPVGSVIDFDGTVLPTGFELPNGQTLSGSYPDYLAAKGSLVTRDITGRVIAMKEATATRLTVAGSGIDGGVRGAAGGIQSTVLVQANLPAITLNTDIAAGQGSHSHGISGQAAGFGGGGAAGVGAGISGGAAPLSINPATLPAMTGTTPLGGSGTPVAAVQPTIVLDKLLVVE